MIFAAIAAVAALSGIAGFNATRNESNISALGLANIEALSTIEDSQNESKYHLQPCSHSTGTECVKVDREYDCYQLRYCD